MAILAVSSMQAKDQRIQKIENPIVKFNNCTNLAAPICPKGDYLKTQALFKLPSRDLSSNNISFKGLILKPNLFKHVAATETHQNWLKLITRETPLYERENNILSEFSRDFNRVIHSDAFKRLAGKTQVFTHPDSDMISTRMLHVEYVSSNGEDISNFMGLNSKLVRVGCKAHDIGQPPFGHDGEKALDRLMQDHNIKSDFWQGRFWHEKNGLRVVDDIETLPDYHGYHRNLNLTYAARDSIVCHCGEVDENGLRPRLEHIDLRAIQFNNRPQPFGWEGCVTKASDKTGYLGVDIEDALNKKFLPQSKKKELIECVEDLTKYNFKELNNTILMNHFIAELCAKSNPEEGLKFSDETFKLMNTVKKFNYEEIYNPIKEVQVPYINLVINTIFDNLNELYDSKNTLSKIDGKKQPKVISYFREWLVKYSDVAPEERKAKKYANKVIYSIENPDDYKLSIIEYIAGMTDKFASNSYKEIIFSD